MIENKKIAVVVPAYNESKQIKMVIDSMPTFVDRIVIVNDRSKDDTGKIVLSCIKDDKTNVTPISIENKQVVPNKYNYADVVVCDINNKETDLYIPSEVVNKDSVKDRIVLINNLENGGVGAAIANGYKWCRDHNIDCTAVMAGDGQMDPDELKSICNPVIYDDVDYVKGNRLIHKSARLVVPKVRFIGNSILSMLTKIASGYWHVSDTQTGYTAMSLRALRAIELHKIYKKYGMPNDMLVKLNIAYCTIKEVEIKPIYKVGEESKMKIWKVIPSISKLLLKLFFVRLWKKYFIRDFHPLFLLYNLGLFLFIVSIPVTVKILFKLFSGQNVSYQLLIIFIFLVISGFQSIFFAMWMDIQDNERLYK